MVENRWVRKCQECGNVQPAQRPNPDKELTDSYRNSKCRKCKSESLDYGKEIKIPDSIEKSPGIKNSDSIEKSHRTRYFEFHQKFAPHLREVLVDGGVGTPPAFVRRVSGCLLRLVAVSAYLHGTRKKARLSGLG